MTESKAKALAAVLGGTAVHTGGGHWTVRLTNSARQLVVFGDTFVGTYADEDAYKRGETIAEIDLC